MYRLTFKYKDGASGERIVTHAELTLTIERMCVDGVFKPELEYFRIETVEKEN
jgi:hypothetical protein